MFYSVVLLRQDPQNGIEFMHSGFHITDSNITFMNTAYSSYSNVKILVAI